MVGGGRIRLERVARHKCHVLETPVQCSEAFGLRSHNHSITRLSEISSTKRHISCHHLTKPSLKVLKPLIWSRNLGLDFISSIVRL
jgi:hypothetical protein